MISDMRVLRSLVVNKSAVGIPIGREIRFFRVSRSFVVNKDTCCGYAYEERD